MGSKLKIWLQATRPFSFTASVIPVLLGTVLAYSFRATVSWHLLPLVLSAAILLHAATNLINDYYDFKKGVDKKGAFGSSGVLVAGLERPGTIFILGYLLFALGLISAVPLILLRGMPLVLLAIIGLLGGVFYTSEPFGYKYIGLGDFFVFILMGPLMVIGSYVSLTGSYAKEIFYISLPVGFLVTAILSSNNLRDIRYDKEAKVRTLENTIGYTPAKIFNVLLIIAAYAYVLSLVFAKILSHLSLIVFLSLPQAARSIRRILRSEKDKPQDLADIDIANARLHMIFGALLIISILFQRIIK